MGFREGIKSGGGFWNDVDGVLKDYTFTNVGPGANGEETAWVYFVPSMLIDNAKATTTQHLFMGAMDRYNISDDGKTITSLDGGPVKVGESTPTGRFLSTLLDREPKAEALLPDLGAGEALNLRGIVGTRLRLGQEIDEKGTATKGKRRDAKTGREYNRTNTIVTRVYSLPSANTAPAAMTMTPGNGAVTAYTIAADAIIAALSKAKDNKLAKAKLTVPVLQFISGDATRKPHQQTIQKLITDDAYLRGLASVGVKFDGSELALVQN